MGGGAAEQQRKFHGPDHVVREKDTSYTDFNDVCLSQTQGAGSDFEQATRIAHTMVTKLGMSEKVFTQCVRKRKRHAKRTRVGEGKRR